ncbi:chalcone isomerase-like protein 1 [Gossypium raimondii]|uniref:Chalcone isomerase domain-containing protein n=2 Tax=Gossypium raimondii TaxID=29730 RepID=A0A0D2PXB4_GOSRA|nr:chalcone isomerase-like protein 1 [Gossypium raimondii]KJB11564.1 hypothetical protein B456_001G266000 [Gossypium raimondii]
MATSSENTIAKATQEVTNDEKETNGTEEVAVEPKTGVSFPVKLDDGKQLNCVGLRKKSMFGLGIKVYSYGMYALLKSKIEKALEKPTKELYQMVINSDVEIMVRLVIVYSSLTISMVRKNFGEGLGASIKKLNGGKKNDELANKVMGQASDDIKLTLGSLIEISRLPGFVLETKVMGEVISKVESELLCRAYINMYIGDDPLDKDAKDKFGISLISLF